MIVRNNSRAKVDLGTITAPTDTWHQERIALMKTKKIAATHKIKHWIEIFDSLAQYDEIGDVKYKNASATAGTFAALSFFSFFIFLFIGLYWWMLLCPFFAGLFVIFSNKSVTLKETDIENHFRLYVLPLFYVFEQEASSNARLKLNLDFNNPEQKDYLIQNIPNTNSAYPHVTINFYKINWLEAQIQFADKTQIQIAITDLIRVSSVSKRNPRGKLKSKTKRKIKQIISIKVLFSKKQYQPNTSQPSALVEQADGYCIKLKSANAIKTINSSINYDEYNDMNPLLSVIAQAYAAVKPI
jgi:hypothetical protein